MIHPTVIGDDDKEGLLEKLKGFLTGLAGCQLLNAKAVCKEAVLPSISVKSPQPEPDALLHLTKLSNDILGSDLGLDPELWVLTKTGDIKMSKEVFLSTEFRPVKNWEAHNSYVPGLSFVSPAYLPDSPDDEILKIWHWYRIRLISYSSFSQKLAS